MRGVICLTSLFLLSLVLLSCSSARNATGSLPTPLPVTNPADWSYQKAGISLHLRADPKLNLFRNTPHTLLLCIYHLRDPNGFQQLQSEKDGLQRLLDCNRFDSSVMHARTLVVQPGQEIEELMDRADGAKFIGIAAGYYKGDRKLVTRAYPVPLLEEIRGGGVAQITQRLSIHLYLGPHGITEFHHDADTDRKNNPQPPKDPEKQNNLKSAYLTAPPSHFLFP